jgi:hypothetical protein
MSGKCLRGRWFAVFALFMALLVPVRAVALCCLEGVVDTRQAAGGHGAIFHHAHDGEGGGESGWMTPGPGSDCDEAVPPVSLVRERIRSDAESVADHPALRRITVLVMYVSPGETSEYPEPSPSRLARVERPLRL